MTPILNPSKGVYTYNCVEYDSKEEIYFSWYLDELFTAGYIAEYDYQPPSFNLSESVKYSWVKELKTKNKSMETTLLQPHDYTADFKIAWNTTADNIFFDLNKLKSGPFVVKYGLSFIDVKPSFDKHNMTRKFHIDQKWVYQRFGVYVQKVVPQKLFKATFTPNRYLYTDKSAKLSSPIFRSATPLMTFIKGG